LNDHVQRFPPVERRFHARDSIEKIDYKLRRIRFSGLHGPDFFELPAGPFR
jgi:hypothetical protein